MTRIGREQEKCVHNHATLKELMGTAYDAVTNIEGEIFRAGVGQQILDHLMEHFIQTGPNIKIAGQYRQIVLTADDVEMIVHAVQHVEEMIKDAKKAQDKAREAIIAARDALMAERA